jgi:hypothetical protein
MQGFLVNTRKNLAFFKIFFLLAFSTSSTSLASARRIHIQLRFAAS